MDKMIYVAMTGAKSVLLRQDNLAANLANASTAGYRSISNAVRSIPIEAIPGSSAPATRVFAIETGTGADLTPGPVQRTGRSLDIAVNGDGWIAVQGAGGREAYTRSGALEVGTSGLLQSVGGRLVIGEGGPISVPPESILTIGTDGTVSAQTNGQPLSEVQTLGRIKLVNPPGKDLVRGEDGLFRSSSGAPVAADERVTLTPAALEGSNVNAVDALVGMISAARQFELHMKLLQTAESNSRSAGQLLQLG